MRDIITIFGVNIDNVTEEESAQITKELIKESNKASLSKILIPK